MRRGASEKRRMKKKITVLILSAMLCALCVTAEAQQPKKVHRIGFLAPGDPVSQSTEAIRLALRELGYIEGQNIAIEYRYGEGKPDRFPELAAELVRLKVDIIVVVGGNRIIPAATNATKTIPIVMATSGDPVAYGYVASLAQPGGNVTGLSQMSPELGGKRLELLKEVLKKVSVVAVLFWDVDRGQVVQMKEVEVAARALGIQLQIVKVLQPNDLENAFSAMTKGRANALIALTGTNFTYRGRIADLAAKSQLPAIYPGGEFVDAGGLISYGPDITENYRRAATYVDKILKDRKPADLPVEQPTKFELVINLKAARRIGLTIPPNVLARADKVIK